MYAVNLGTAVTEKQMNMSTAAKGSAEEWVGERKDDCRHAFSLLQWYNST